MPHPCSFLGTFFILSAVILLIFVHISQITTGQKVPRSLRMVTVDASGVAPGVVGHNYYEWGLWAYCASTEKSNSADFCTSTTFGNEFQPASALLADGNAQQINPILPNGTFVAGNYTGQFTKIAFYLLFVGAILSGAAMLLSITANRFGYVLAALVAFLAWVCVAAGATIWTIIIHKVKDSVAGTGLNVSYGNALWLTWGAAAALILAVIPLFIACCTGRHNNDDDYRGGMSEYGGNQSQYAGSRRGSVRNSKRGSQYEPSIRY